MERPASARMVSSHAVILYAVDSHGPEAAGILAHDFGAVVGVRAGDRAAADPSAQTGSTEYHRAAGIEEERERTPGPPGFVGGWGWYQSQTSVEEKLSCPTGRKTSSERCFYPISFDGTIVAVIVSNVRV